MGEKSPHNNKQTHLSSDIFKFPLMSPNHKNPSYLKTQKCLNFNNF